MKNKKFKYEIKGTDQFIKIPCSYKTIEENFLIKEFIVTEELLDHNQLPLTKFLSFLKGELDKSDKYFYVCKEVHNFNGPISISNIKHPINLINKGSLLNVIEITTAT
ncbi:MAG: hypothetical protein VW827_03575 [Alphaproteobacteria bacterium]